MSNNNGNVLPFTKSKTYDELHKELEVEYVKMNKGVLEIKPTAELVSLQASHFQNATKMMNNANMLMKHISLISSILAVRNMKGPQ